MDPSTDARPNSIRGDLMKAIIHYNAQPTRSYADDKSTIRTIYEHEATYKHRAATCTSIPPSESNSTTMTYFFFVCQMPSFEKTLTHVD